MKNLCLIAIFLCSNTVFAKDRLAVLNIEGEATQESRLYLTDNLRRFAQKHTDYKVYTNENIQVLVPQEILNDCVGKCEVEVGKNLNAHYIISGRIYKLNHTYRLILKVHNIRTSEMQNSVQIIAESVDELSQSLERSFLDLMKVRKKTFEDIKIQYLAMLQAKEDEQRRLREIQKAKELEAQRVWEEEKKRQRSLYKRKRKQIQAEEAKRRKNYNQKEVKKERLNLKREYKWEVESPFDINTIWFDLNTNAQNQRFSWFGRDSAYEDCNSSFDTCEFELLVDQIATSHDGVAYDKAGNELIPQTLPMLQNEHADYTLAYVEPTLWKSDLNTYQTRLNDNIKASLIYGLVSTPLAVATVGLSFDYKLYNNRDSGRNSVALFKTSPLTYGTLLGSFLISTIVATWLVVDHNDYHYPKYIDKIESALFLDQNKKWLKKLKYMEQRQKELRTQRFSKHIESQIKQKSLVGYRKVKHQLAIGKDWDRSKCVKDARINGSELVLKHIKEPRIYQSSTVKYTQEAILNGIKEKPTFDLCIDSRGKVRAIKTVKSVGHGLDTETINAMQDWWFFPAEYTKRKTIPFILKNVQAHYKL